jgi:hypothetical protein
MRLNERMGCIWEYYSEFGFDICLFAEFVGGDSVELFVAFDWYYFCAIGENGMIRTFSEEAKNHAAPGIARDHVIRPTWSTSMGSCSISALPTGISFPVC